MMPRKRKDGAFGGGSPNAPRGRKTVGWGFGVDREIPTGLEPTAFRQLVRRAGQTGRTTRTPAGWIAVTISPAAKKEIAVAWIWLAVGGVLGVWARYAISAWAMRFVLGGFPLGTLLVNVIGCFAAGAVMAHVAYEPAARENLRLLVVVGFLGAFTTFSAFGIETWTLIDRGAARLALLNVVLNVALGLAGAWVGRALNAT